MPKGIPIVEEHMFQMEPVEKGTSIPSFRRTIIISQEALIAFSLAAVGIERIPPLINDNQYSLTNPSEEIHTQEDLHPFCSPVIHPTTGELITSYKRLAKDPELKEVWETGFGKEWGSLAQGDKRTGSIGTDTFVILRPEQVLLIPNDRVVTYANITQKEDPNRVSITAGGNLIIYPGELTTRTADITTSKILWSSVLSTKKSKYMCLDI